MALDKKIGVEGEAAKAAQNEGIASTGFLGDRRCTSIYEIADPSNIGDFRDAPLKEGDWDPRYWTCSNWTIYTPGKIAAEAIVKAANLDIDWLISAKEFEEYLNEFDACEIKAISSRTPERITKPGTWLRKNDPIAFQVGYDEWSLEYQR